MGYIEHYSNYNSLNNDVVKETENTIGALFIKFCILGILLYIIYKINYDTDDNYIKSYSVYTIIFLLIFLLIFIGLLFGLDIITFFKLSVFIIFGLFMLALIYKYLDKLRFIILFYHSFNYQLEKIYNETKTNYNEVLFSFIFIAIISIISIVLYWDNIYTDAKKLSKCGKIINTIENNNRMKKPFIYNIIIINNDLIDTTTSKYILKITYDFMKKKTVIDYGTDDGNYGDGNEIIEAQKELVFYYFNLRTMKSEKIANIDATVLNEGRFKYILVDDNNNKLPHDETAQDLIKFTKIYSKNENYNINIINDIFYAKNNREKLFI
jgi:Ca2+/Na+ antiporter